MFLDCCTPVPKSLPTLSTPPHPSDCELFYVNRDTLFSYHPVSEVFLQRMMSLYVASHYKNTPNDLQLLGDAPAHHLFVLLPPIAPNTSSLPSPLVVLQITLEGSISRSSIMSSLSKGQRSAGDLIPWCISQQFGDDDFARLSGARIVRIATAVEYIGMGYGGRAIECLEEYLSGKIQGVSEEEMDHTNDHSMEMNDEELEQVK